MGITLLGFENVMATKNLHALVKEEWCSLTLCSAILVFNLT